MSVRIATGGAAEEAVGRVLPRLVDERVASGITAQDPDLWGADAEADAARKLGWTESVAAARPLAIRIAELREELRADGAEHVVLCAVGGAALGADLVARSQGVPLTVLDSTDPDRVRAVLETRFEQAAVVLADGPGITLETDCHRRSVEEAFRNAGIEPARRIIVVTDPGSPLEALAGSAGYRLVSADPMVGAPYSALTAFGLVPAGLAGADLDELIDEAESELLDLAIDAPSNNGLVLGAAIAGAVPRRAVLALVADGTHLTGLADWVEQLVAGSTGKLGTGILPIVLAADAPELSAGLTDLQVVRFVDDAHAGHHRSRPADGEILVSGSLGELLLVWEYALAVAGRLIGVDPFDEPDSAAVASAARALLDSPRPEAVPAFVQDGAEVRASGDLAIGDSLRSAIDALIAAIPQHGHLAVQVWGTGFHEAEDLRAALATRLRRPVPLGRGPRSLHTTGQYHRGGPPAGVFLQITTSIARDLQVPGLHATYGDVITAQARTDAEDLARRGRPVLRVHLTEPGAAAALLNATSPTEATR